MLQFICKVLELLKPLKQFNPLKSNYNFNLFTICFASVYSNDSIERTEADKAS